MRGGIYGTLVLFALIFLIPIYMTAVTAFKTLPETRLSTVWNLPTQLNFTGFEQAIERFGPSMGNSFTLVIVATIVSAALGSMNGYVLSKWRIPGERVIFPLILFGMFLPYQAILIPLFRFMNDIGLYGGIPGLILVHVVYGIPITTLIFRNFYAEIPDEMLEAGTMDGAGFWQLYTQVVFPLSVPGFVVVIIWQFTQIWNDFLFAIFLTTESSQPITVPLAILSGGREQNFPMMMSGALLAALPPLLVYIVMGRYFIRGLLAGSVKG
ncbi:MAG: carbohydrate ABC transporter permease [Anaerolineaceae bacterium]|nr:MAG: carbohydrate ABC transporter permease [Anaerolineaceae bacterium]